MDTVELIDELVDSPIEAQLFAQWFTEGILKTFESLDPDDSADWLLSLVQDIVHAGPQAERALIQLVGEEVFDSESYFDVE